MKTIKWSLLTTAVLASLVFSVTIQQQNVAAFNDKNNQNVFNHHDHSRISEDEIQSNEGHAVNDEDSHFNDNFNSNRGETFEERYKCNSHSKPANTGTDGDVPCLE
jgi:hypothetical protein